MKMPINWNKPLPGR